jgi:glycosyltransferase involved in cell wall biosynthesis
MLSSASSPDAPNTPVAGIARSGRWNIVHVTARYPPGLGGVERVVQHLARNQYKSGVTVSVLTTGEGRDELAQEDEPFRVTRLRSVNVLHTPLVPALLPHLLALDRDALVHLHISHAYTPEMVWIYSRLTGRPYLAHFHGNLGPSGHVGRLLFGAYKRLIIGLVLRGAHTVVALTDDDKSALVTQFGIDPSRIALIRNGVDESFSYSRIRDLHSKPRLLFVGRLTVQKNLPLLLAALDGVSDRFETTLVGRGELEAELKSQVRDLQLQNVRFHGAAQGNELVRLYQDADVFVLPSVLEGMPLALLEAMASGLPIVGTDVPGTRDLVAPGENGVLVKLGEPSELRQALLEVTSDSQRYRSMSGVSRAIASTYSWDGVVSELAQIYSRIYDR